MKSNQLQNNNVNKYERRPMTIGALCLLILMMSLSFSNNVKAQVLEMDDFVVFGGDSLCPNGPGQTPPGGTDDCRVHIGVGSVINGHVGSYHFVEANGDVDVNGNIHSGGRVNLANGDLVHSVTAANGDVVVGTIFMTGNSADILGNIDVNGNIFVNNNGSFVIGTVTHPVGTTYSGPLPGGGEVEGPPSLPTLPVMPPIAVLTCPTGNTDSITGTQTITPGSYGDIITDNGAMTITFSGAGDYFFNSIKMGQGGKHYFLYDFQGSGGKINIYVCGDVNLGDFEGQFVNPSPQDTCNIYFETHGDGSTNGTNSIYSFLIAPGSDFYGTVWAPYAGIKVGAGQGATYVKGHLWSATQVNVQHDVTIDSCTSCTQTITICKTADLCPDDLCTEVIHDWRFTSNIPGYEHFIIHTVDTSALRSYGCITIDNIPPGFYTVSEDIAQFVDGTGLPPACALYNPSVIGCTNCVGTAFNSASFDSTCAGSSASFYNTRQCTPNVSCQWCNKGAVLSQVWQNPGKLTHDKCVVPDILVDVMMAHGGENDTVTADEILTGEPATWSIQEAIDYVNTYGDPSPVATPGEIFIGVTATQPEPVDPNDSTSCGKACARPPAGDNPFGTENVIVNNLNTERLNIFGCSVTMHPADANLPVFTIQDGVGKVTILDLHVKFDNVAGYLIKGGANGNADLVVVKNSAAWFNDIGYDVQDDDVEITGAQHINGNRIGILVSGSNVKLRTNKDILNNSEAGIKITGDFNESNGNEVGNDGDPNAVGIIVTGNNNDLHDDDVNYNTGHGIVISGNLNTLDGEDANNNGGAGFFVSGNNNTLEGNNQVKFNGGDGFLITGDNNLLDGNAAEENGGNGFKADIADGANGNQFDDNEAENNTLQGIRACGQVDLGDNSASGNGVDPQIAFTCGLLANAKFSVVDLSADKAYKYDASFNLISSSSLTNNNGDNNDATANGASTYVLDKNDKQVYRYVGVNATSRVLKETGGGALSVPSGIVIDGDQLWVVDDSKKRIYRYSLSAAFTGSGNINALQQINFTGNNADGEGLIIDATYVYVLDNSDKMFYRYPRVGGAGVASKVMKETGGGSLGNPMGATLDGGTVWVVDNNKDKAYSYSLASLFAGAGNLNAGSQFALYSGNGTATGIAVGTSSNLLRLSEENVVSDALIQVYPNPASGSVTVQFMSTTTDKYTVNIIDVTGRVVAAFSDNAKEGINVKEIDISNVASGVYVLILRNSNMEEAERIMVR